MGQPNAHAAERSRRSSFCMCKHVCDFALNRQASGWEHNNAALVQITQLNRHWQHWHEYWQLPQYSPASATNHKSFAFNLKRFLTAGKFFSCFKSIFPCSSWQQFESQRYAVSTCNTAQQLQYTVCS